jgi:hypothetical protein
VQKEVGVHNNENVRVQKWDIKFCLNGFSMQEECKIQEHQRH